jgi:hypothetical protein
LEEYITPLITFVKQWVRKAVHSKAYTLPREIHFVFVCLQYMLTTRGYKTVIKFFPHEVSDMEPVTELLQNCDY